MLPLELLDQAVPVGRIAPWPRETSAVIARSTDAANLAGLLRREPRLCTTCAAVKLSLPLDRVRAAVAELARTAGFHQQTSRCPICCGRDKWVVSMQK